MKTGFTIEDARQVQRDLDLMETHVAYVSNGGLFFVMAHPQTERRLVTATGTPLESCTIHQWLVNPNPGLLSCCFKEPGWYEINRMHEVKGLAL